MCRDSISLRCHKRQNYKLQSCRPRSIYCSAAACAGHNTHNAAVAAPLQCFTHFLLSSLTKFPEIMQFSYLCHFAPTDREPEATKSFQYSFSCSESTGQQYSIHAFYGGFDIFYINNVWVPGLSVVWRQKCLFWLNNSDNSFNDTRRCWEKQWVAENGRNPWCCAIGGWWQIP